MSQKDIADLFEGEDLNLPYLCFSGPECIPRGARGIEKLSIDLDIW